MSKTFPFQSGSCLCKRSTDYDMIGGGDGQYECVKGAKVMIPKGSSRVIPSAPYATTVLNRTNAKQFMDTNLGVGYATTGGAKHNNRHNKKKRHNKKTKGNNVEVIKLPNKKKIVMRKGGLHKSLKVPDDYKFKDSTILRLVKVKNGDRFTFRSKKFVMTPELKRQLSLAKGFMTMRKDKKRKENRNNGRKVVKIGGNGATPLPQRWYNADATKIDYGKLSGVGVPTAYGASNPRNVGMGNLAPFNVAKGASPISMQQTGGGGATPLPQRWYNPNAPQRNYGKMSGVGVPTAYGASNPRNVGMGNLAPFNVARGASPLSMQQTGGKRKKTKGGFTKVGSQPVTNIVKGIQGAVDGIVNKFNSLNQSMASFDTKVAKMLKQSGGLKMEGGPNMDTYNGSYSPRWSCGTQAGGKKKKTTSTKKKTATKKKTTSTKKKTATKKKTTSTKKRPSPTKSATEYKLGTKRKGNDGKMWRVMKTKAGVKRWCRVATAEKKVSKKKTSQK